MNVYLVILNPKDFQEYVNITKTDKKKSILFRRIEISDFHLLFCHLSNIDFEWLMITKVFLSLSDIDRTTLTFRDEDFSKIPRSICVYICCDSLINFQMWWCLQITKKKFEVFTIKKSEFFTFFFLTFESLRIHVYLTFTVFFSSSRYRRHLYIYK